MNGAAAQVRTVERAGAGRLIATWVVLLAFALQSYLTQTHVHPAPAAPERASIVQATQQISAQGAAPAGGEALICPLCQAIAVAGAFFSPAAIAFALPVLLAQAAVPAPAAAGLTLAPAGFGWRSRAPPQS